MIAFLSNVGQQDSSLRKKMSDFSVSESYTSSKLSIPGGKNS